MNIRKTLSFLLSVLIVASVSGCRVKGNPPPEETSTPQPSAASSPTVKPGKENETDAAKAGNYAFDLNDKYSVHFSSGTGGTKWFYNTSTDYTSCFTRVHDKLMDDPGVKFSQEGALHVSGLKFQGLDKKINDFLADARQRLVDNKAFWTDDGEFLGMGINEEVYYSGDIASLFLYSFNNDYTGMETTLSAVYNLKTGEKLQLSDLFYDGFNYIEYINNDIVTQLGKETYYTQTMQYEQLMKRSFTGIPNDYTCFYPGYGKICIYLPASNPFFSTDVSFYIDLYKDVSPYGQEKPIEVTTDYTKVQITDKASVYVPELSVSQFPPVNQKINDDIQNWVTGLSKDKTFTTVLQKISGDHSYNLEPDIWTWGEYVSVLYDYSYDGLLIYNNPIFASISFNGETGERADLYALIGKDYQWSEAEFYREPETGLQYEELQKYSPKLTDYLPGKNAVVTNCWILYNENLCIELNDPSRGKIIAAFPLKNA